MNGDKDMKFYNSDGEIHSFDAAKFRKIRIDHSNTLVMSEDKHKTVMEAVMYLAGVADNFRDYHTSAGDSSVFDDEKVLNETKRIGQELFNVAGTAIMMRVADQLYTAMLLAVEQKITHHTMQHYEIFIRELDHVWQGIGNISGKPIVDYWQV